MRVAATRRVVITGMGLISPLGNSIEALWNALMEGRSGVRWLDDSPAVAGLPIKMAARAWEFSGTIDDFGPLSPDRKKAIRKGLKVMCHESQMGVAAAQRAVANAGLDARDVAPERSGVVFGSDYMLTSPEDFVAGIRACGNRAGQFEYSRWATDGIDQMQPLWLLKYLPNMPASHIAIYHDFRGPNNSITHREAAGNLAVGEAYHTILRGSADRMIAGATGTRVHPMKSVHAMQTEQLATNGSDPSRACRPFDLHRTGMVLGEGAAAIVLEELDSALARKATIFAEVVGAGSSSVVDRNTVAHCDQALANAMVATLRCAGASPADVGHIHAHGLSTVRCDIDEARAIHRVFGASASTVPVVAAKSYFGNLGAGSGMVELIASVLALRAGRLFPILNYQTADPDCAIAAVRSTATPAGRSFLNLSTTPQGQAAVVMIRAYG
ncbi:MAG: 3-oxoacyl-ACP synthase [Planctomycetes bacterium RBG_16_64_10]|nr:MAG: 3-oxoacyl-ACP synthase [Planctomycetes bacterium RBG_16_64_10]